MPEPPLDMVMPAVYQQLMTINYVVLALVLFWIIREARRTRRLLPIMIMAGAMVASLTEALWDHLGAVWYPQYGPTPLYRLLNVSVPFWMVVAYPCYLGGQGYWVYKRLNEGMTRASFWRHYAFFWITNFLVELPVLALSVYTYYGPQPFKVIGFPLWQTMGNCLMPILIGAIVFAWKDFFTGIASLLILAAVPTAQVFALGGVGWPMFLALNSGHGYEVTYPAALLTMGLSLIVAHMVSLKVCKPSIEGILALPR